MRQIRPVEGFFLETPERLIFDVKGLLHPPERIVAYIRYFPCVNGTRARNRVKYSKVYDLGERANWLAKHYPQYLWYCEQWNMEVQAVPDAMANPHDPRKKLQELCTLPKKDLSLAARNAVDLAEIFQHYVPDPTEIGITGSVLVGLENEESDYDLVVYGKKNCTTLFSAMEHILATEADIEKYSLQDMPARYEFRAKGSGLPLDTFAFHEMRKTHQGRFRYMDFFLRYVLYPEELGVNFNTTHFSKVGMVKITGKVQNADLGFFTPCSYAVCVDAIEGATSVPVDCSSITEIASLRGRFCEQLVAGEQFRAQGTLELVTTSEVTHFRLLLGNQPSDYFVKMK